MRRVLLRNGQIVWVNDLGQVVGIAGGGFPGAEPGISDARERDIMSRMPDADVVGLRGPGVVPGGEKGAGVLRGQLEGAPAGQAMPNVRPLQGAQINNRGNVATLTPTDTAFVSVCETAKNPGEDAELVTVVIGIDQGWRDFPLNPAPLKNPQVRGRLEWGMGNAIFTADFDWLQGTSLTLPASYMRVKAAYVPWTGFGTLPDVVVSAGFAYGGLSHSRCPARLSEALDIAIGATSTIEIPPFATSFTIMGVTAGGAQPNITISPDIAGAALPPRFNLLSDTNQATQAEGQYPINNGAANLFITNNSLVGAFTGFVVFTLAL